jgi:hypothetical protein
LQRLQVGDGREFVTGGQLAGLDGLAELLGYLAPAGPGVGGVDDEDRDVAVLGERVAGAGQVPAALEAGVELV